MKEVYRSPEREAVDQYGLIVVGGQALSLWAREYLLDEMTGEEIQFATSDDLDFIGRSEAIGFCERRMDVHFRRATLDDHTPNLAVAEIAWDDDRKIVIDILESIAGVATKDIYRNLESVLIDDVRIAIIDPVSCLQSRLYNLYAPWCSDYQREAVRTNLAIRASKAYLQEILCEEGYSSVRPLLKRLYRMAISRLGRDAFYDYGIDLLLAYPRDICLMPQKFFDSEWPRLNKELNDRRTRKVTHYTRFNRAPRGTPSISPPMILVNFCRPLYQHCVS
ncbi:hypothetical protein ACE0DR_27665 [Azotobacter sp. CWF10]